MIGVLYRVVWLRDIWSVFSKGRVVFRFDDDDDDVKKGFIDL